MQVTQSRRSFSGSRLTLAAGLVVALVFPLAGDAFVRITGGPGASTEKLTLSWNLNRYPSGVPYVLRTTATGDGTQDIEGTQEFAPLREAFRSWQDVPTSRITFQEAGLSRNVKSGALDGVNVVSFDNTNSLLARAGVLALTLPTYRTSGDGVTPGEIAEADIIFLDSDQVIWKTSGRDSIPSTAGAPIQVNLLEVASREVGHFIGLDASFTRTPFNTPLFTLQKGVIILDHRFDTFSSTALMYPYVLNNSPVQNGSAGYGFLTPDEIAACSALYPTNNAFEQLGSLSGTITLKDVSTGSVNALCGAHVIATQPGASIPMAGTLTKADGTYRIDGLPAGNYLVYVEPTSPLDYQSTYENLNEAALDFIPEFFNNAYFSQLSKAGLISVAPGVDTGGIDVEVVRSIGNSEVTYALGGLTDKDGKPVIIKAEPDNSIDLADNLSDDDRDGLIVVESVIQTVGDHDFYSFRAQRDDVYKIEVQAYMLGSALDPVLQVYGPGAQALPFAVADNTPGLGLDPRVIFTVPQTDTYYVEVFNASATAGTDHYYQLVIEKISGRVPVTPLGGPVAVLSVPITDASLEAVGFTNPTYGHIEITEFKVQFLDVDGDGGLNTDGADFLPPSREPNASVGGFVGGFAIFNDNGPTLGKFDYDSVAPSPAQDLPITMATVPTITTFGFGFEVTFTPAEPLVIPAERLIVSDASPDFHIVVQPSLLLHHGDDFQVIIPVNGIKVRNNISGILQQATLFPQAYPTLPYRNKYTGDIVELQPFIPNGGGNVGAKSIDYPVVGINLIGDPAEGYWVSQVELSILGYSYHSLRDLGISSLGWDFLYDWFQRPNPIIRLLDLTDFLPLTNGTTASGGFNLYADNDTLGSTSDGVPNFGLNGDFLVALTGTQHYEVIPLGEITNDLVLALLPHSMQTHVDVDDFLFARDDLNMFAFKVVLPVLPQSDRLVPDSDTLAEGTLGSDMFITLRTSNTVDALDVFLPFVQVDGVRVSNNLSEVIRYQDPSRSTLINGGSLRSIDNFTNPSMGIVEIRPEPYIQLRDLVNPADPTSRGNVIGTAAQGSPPMAVIGINAHDYNSSALVTHNGVGTGDIPTGNHVINTGVVLNSLIVFIDPAESPSQLPLNFLRPVTQVSLIDPDLIDLSIRGIDLITEDDTIAGNVYTSGDPDDDTDGPTIYGSTDTLVDEELRNGTDDDLDGITDENDFGDEDAVGLNGQFDGNDDTMPYLQPNDYRTFNPTVPHSEFASAPVVAQQPNGSLRVDFPDLRSHVIAERLTAFELMMDPLSIFIDAVFFRIDHNVLTIDPAVPVPSKGAVVLPIYSHGVILDGGDDLTWLTGDPPYVDLNYYYLTEIPNNDTATFLQGPDFFITARVGTGANIGDSFRMRIPAQGLKYSFYRSANPYTENIRSASVPLGDFSSSNLNVGGDNIPPSLTFIRPSGADSRAQAVIEDGRVTYDFEVQFLFSDPDNAASVDFYWDTDRIGLDGDPIPPVEGETTTNIIDNDGRRPYSFTFRFPEELARKTIGEAYIYGIVRDEVNPAQAIYAPAAIILDATSRIEAPGVVDFLIADNLGQIFGTGSANINIPEYRQSTNSIRDVELTPSELGALYLHGFGDVVLRGDPGVWAKFVRTSESVVFPEGGSINFGMDIARDVEAHWDGNRYYILDGMGGVHCVGAPATFTLTGIPASVDDIYRDMELTATNEGLEILSGFGGVYPLGDGPRFTNVPSFGLDIARDMALTPTGAYILDAYGGIYNIGLAPAIDSSTSVIMYPGSDVYRAIEYLTGGVGLLVMDREGQVFAVGDILLGPNPVPAGTVGMPDALNVGDPITFTPPLNVVTGESPGAFIDLEFAQAGEISKQVQGNIMNPLEGLCHAVSREDLTAMLGYLRPDFLDEQGHDRSDFAAVWQAFFNHYRVISCSINEDSVTITQSNTAANTYIVSASASIFTMDPILSVFAPADDPLTLENADSTDTDAGEVFTVGPVQIDQVARFWETDDGRGWRLRIIDDDYTNGVIDRADPVLDERYFTKTRARTKREGEGVIYLNEEDQVSKGSSQNSTYILHFLEQVEGHASSVGGPIGGWFHPVLYFLWFNPVEAGEQGVSGTIPTSIFRVFVEFTVYVDPVTQIASISGGTRAVWALLSTLQGGLGTVGQTESLQAQIDNPVGWRFFDKLGITVEAGRDLVYDSHLTAAEGGGATDTVVLNVPDISSSAYLINLREASDALAIPFGTLPLDDDLDIRDAQGNLILPDYRFWTRTTTVQPGDDVVVTFRADEQGGVTNRLNYAVIHVINVNGPINNNSYTNLAFTWRYRPATDFIPYFNAFK